MADKQEILKKQLLTRKVALLQDMLQITKEYSDFLDTADTVNNGEEVYQKTMAFLKERERLIEQVNALDDQRKQIQDSAPDDTELSQNLAAILRNLVQLQSHIDGLLQQSQTDLKQKVARMKRLRQLAKGYYNHQMAVRPRFIDDKR